MQVQVHCIRVYVILDGDQRVSHNIPLAATLLLKPNIKHSAGELGPRLQNLTGLGLQRMAELLSFHPLEIARNFNITLRLQGNCHTGIRQQLLRILYTSLCNALPVNVAFDVWIWKPCYTCCSIFLNKPELQAYFESCFEWRPGTHSYGV